MHSLRHGPNYVMPVSFSFVIKKKVSRNHLLRGTRNTQPGPFLTRKVLTLSSPARYALAWRWFSTRLDRQVRFALANYTSTSIQKSVTILGWVCEFPPRENVSGGDGWRGWGQPENQCNRQLYVCTVGLSTGFPSCGLLCNCYARKKAISPKRITIKL